MRVAGHTAQNVPIKLRITTYEYTAYNGVSEARNDADLTMPQGNKLSNYFVYNAKSSVL